MKIKKIIMISIPVILIVVGFFYVKNNLLINNEITGQEWLEKQQSYVDEMQEFSNNMDDVTSLYLIGSISQEDFINHVTTMQQELNIMKSCYKKDKENNPVKIGSANYLQKLGCESVEDCYTVLENMLTMMSNNYADKEKLSYKYLAYNDELIKYVAAYSAALDE